MGPERLRVRNPPPNLYGGEGMEAAHPRVRRAPPCHTLQGSRAGAEALSGGSSSALCQAGSRAGAVRY